MHIAFGINTHHSFTLLLTMEPHRHKQYVLIVCDSRGAWLHRELNRYQSYLLKFSVIYRKGASLEELWEIIEWNLLTKRIDYVFILGGICNITDRCFVDGRRQYWPPADLDERFSRIHQVIRDIARNFNLLKTNAKLIILPEPGIDLIRFNGIHHPVPWRKLVIQSELEERLELLQLYVRAINSHLGVTTPWSLDITHTYRNHEIHPVYDRLRDGLHFTGTQVSKLAKILAEYVEDDITKSRSIIKLLLIMSLHTVLSCNGHIFVVLNTHSNLVCTSSDWIIILLQEPNSQPKNHNGRSSRHYVTTCCMDHSCMADPRESFHPRIIRCRRSIFATRPLSSIHRQCNILSCTYVSCAVLTLAMNLYCTDVDKELRTIE